VYNKICPIDPTTQTGPGFPVGSFYPPGFFTPLVQQCCRDSLDAFIHTGQSQWLYDTTRSAAQLGLLGAVQLVQLPVALYGGMLADRFDRKKLLALTLLANTLLFVLLTMLAPDITPTVEYLRRFRYTGMFSMLGNVSQSGFDAQGDAP